MAEMRRSWFEAAALGARIGKDLAAYMDVRTMTVGRPEPEDVVIAVCGADGARAWTVSRKETLADEGVMPQILASLADVQAEVRRA